MRRCNTTLSHAEIKAILGWSSRTIVEMGAHYGEDSQRFLDAFPQCRLFCFECSPVCIEVFKRRITDPRCVLLERAICDLDGSHEFHPSSGTPPTGFPDPECKSWTYSGSLNEPTGHLSQKWCKFDEDGPIIVPTIRFDSWYRQTPAVNIIDFVWCDIQGAEHQMIIGGKAALAHTRYLYTEFADEEQYATQKPLAELVRMMPDFELLAIYGGDNALLRNRNL